jgi:glycosyltransferase involved in cell wall biosynthesis
MPELSRTLSGLGNVSISGPVSRNQLLEEYRAADILFLHLNDQPAFRKVLPSKIFEYAATGKPILAGLAGYAREFMKANVSNVSLFEPCQIEDAVTALEALDTHPRDRSQFVSRFSREKLMTALAADVLAVARGN